jgi:T-complex protein 1 subunit beta
MFGNNAPGQAILNASAVEEKGEIARLASFVGAMAVSDLVKTTLGPKGMDKILLSTVRSRVAAAAAHAGGRA